MTENGFVSLDLIAFFFDSLKRWIESVAVRWKSYVWRVFDF